MDSKIITPFKFNIDIISDKKMCCVILYLRNMCVPYHEIQNHSNFRDFLQIDLRNVSIWVLIA